MKPYKLKNSPFQFQPILNDYSEFSIVHVLTYSKILDQHFKHLKTFFNVIKRNGLAISALKMKLFQTKIRLLGHDIFNGTIKPIQWSIEFADKFRNEIKDKNQLQRFFGCLNYVADFLPKFRETWKPFFQRFKKNPPTWPHEHTRVLKYIKSKFKSLPCLGIANPHAFMIIQTDASDKDFGGILKR